MNYREIALQLVDRARAAGADEVDVYLTIGRDFEVTVRNKSIEVLKQALSKGVGIRVFRDHRMGFGHTTDFSADSLNRLVEQTLQMAKYATQDEFHGLPSENHQLVPADTGLDLYDTETASLATEKKIALAKAMEEAALAYDKRVKIVEGASFSEGDERIFIGNSRGFSGEYTGTGSTLVCSVIAEEEGGKQVNYWYSNKRHFKDHPSPEVIGRKAAERTVRMLKARKIPSGKFPVIFDPLIASSFLGSIASALNGESVFRKTSFLTDKLGASIASDLVTIIDDGLLKRGLSSRPFDGEGVPTRRKTIVEKGKLRSYLYDSYTARKAKTATTGNASRSYSSTPQISPLNFFIEPGPHSPEKIIASIADGFYVTGMIGFGVDTVTGQFSRGASGLWIKNGELAFPVHEVTVAGNMLEMLQNIEMVGNDLEFFGPVASPTIKISEMSISGT
ncbi:MAG TPA: TldD/PmbA family protein [Bacteroidota bacterium]|nr:TldD/PmbA family protein [Bacteroidota bacterium]